MLLSRAAEVYPKSKKVWKDPIMKCDLHLSKQVLKYLESIQDYKQIKPICRYLFRPGQSVVDIILFHDGSMLFSKQVPNFKTPVCLLMSTWVGL